MANKNFLIAQEGFSFGQVSLDHSSNYSQKLKASGALKLKNFIIDNGASLVNRPGTDYKYSLDFPDDFASNTKMIDFLGYIFVLTNTGLYYLGDDGQVLVSVLSIPNHSAQGFIDVDSVVATDYDATTIVSIPFCYPPTDSLGVYSFTDEEIQNAKFTILGRALMVNLGENKTFFCTYNSALNKFIISDINELGVNIRNESKDIYLSPTGLNPKYVTSVYNSPDDFPLRIITDDKKYTIVEVSSTNISNAFHLNSSAKMYILSNSVSNIASDPSLENSIVLFSAGNQNYLLYPTEFKQSLGQQNFTIYYPYPIGSDSTLENLSALFSGGDSTTASGTTFTYLDTELDINFWKNDWSANNLPLSGALLNRLVFFKQNKVWASSVRDVTSFFDFKTEIDLPGDPVVGSGKNLEFNLSEDSENILEIKTTTDNYMFFTDKNIYSLKGDVYQQEGFYLVSKQSVLNNAGSVTLDSSIYTINSSGELIRVVYNFNESAFNVINYSKRLFFNNDIRFIKVFELSEISNYLFCLSEDNKFYLLYYENDTKIYSWSYLEFEDVQDFVVKGDKILFLYNNVEIYSFDFKDRANKNVIRLDYKQLAIKDTVNLNMNGDFKIDSKKVKYKTANKYPSTSLSGFVAYPEINGEYNVNISFPIVANSIEGSKASGFTKWIIGKRYDAEIELLPVIVTEQDGISVLGYKNIDDVLVSADSTGSFSVSVNDIAVFPQEQLQWDKPIKDIFVFKGFTTIARKISIKLVNALPKYIKILGINIRGYLK